MKLRTILALCTSIVALQAYSCNGPTISKTTASLSATAKGSTEKVSHFYKHINEIHSKIFLDYKEIGEDPVGRSEVPSNPQLPKEIKDVDSIRELLIESPGDIGSNGTKPYYSLEAIKARTLATSALETYAVNLQILSSSTSSAESKKAMSDLQNNLSNLGVEFSSLKLTASPTVARQVEKLGGLAQLGNMGAQALIGHFRNKWTPETVRANNEFVSNSCVALNDDVRLTAKRAKTSLAGLQRHWDVAFASKKTDRKYLDELAKISDLQAQIDSENPSEIFTQYSGLHSKLAKLVEDKK